MTVKKYLGYLNSRTVGILNLLIFEWFVVRICLIISV